MRSAIAGRNTNDLTYCGDIKSESWTKVSFETESSSPIRSQSLALWSILFRKLSPILSFSDHNYGHTIAMHINKSLESNWIRTCQVVGNRQPINSGDVGLNGDSIALIRSADQPSERISEPGLATAASGHPELKS